MAKHPEDSTPPARNERSESDCATGTTEDGPGSEDPGAPSDGGSAPPFDATETGDLTVVLCVEDSGTRHSLREWFEAQDYAAVAAEAGSLPADGDLYVVDQGALGRTAPVIADRKRASATYVPCLLVATSEHADHIATSDDATLSSDDDALSVVDDVLYSPLQTPALRRRVESLLRARSFSKRLQRRTDRYEQLVDVLPAGLFLLDDDHTVTDANAAASDLVDEPVSDLTGTSFLELVSEADRERVLDVMDAPPGEPGDRSGESDAGFARESLEVEFRTRHERPGAQGSLTADQARRRSTAELYVTKGACGDGYQVLAYDVSDRTHRLERLRVFERAIEAADVGLTVADARADDDPLVFVNDAFLELTGYEREDVLGRNCRFLQGEGTDDATVGKIREALDANSPVSVTVRNYRADGTPFWNALDIAPVRDDDGTVTHFLGFQRDVTDRRERMQLFEHLHDATERLQRARTPTAVAEVAVDAIQEILGLETAECWFPSESGTRLDTVALAGLDVGHPIDSSTPDWDVYVDQEPVREVPIVDHDLDADRGILLSLGEHGLLGAADAERPYTQALRDAGRVFADQVTVALDRAHREEELAATKQDLESTLERINDGFMAVDADFVVSYVNQRAKSILPYTSDDIVGESLWEVFPAAVDGPFETHFRRALTSQRPETFETELPERDAWVAVSVYPSTDGLTIYVRDVTESRERQRELERYERIVQTAGDPIYSLDENGCFRDANRAFADLTGYEPEEVRGEFAGVVLDDVDVRRCERAIAELVDREDLESRTVDITVITKEGERRQCELSIAQLPGESFSGTVGVIRDVTDLKDTEQRVAVLDRVLRHNLRNNLNVVAGQAEGLVDHEDDDVADVAAVVEDAARDVLEMAEKARTFQHALGDSDERTTRTADVCTIVRDAIDVVTSEEGRSASASWGASSPSAASPDASSLDASEEDASEEDASEEDASPSVTVDVDPPVYIHANEAVELSVRELVENALVHNPASNPSVDVTVTRSDGDAIVEVSDDGPPIPDAEIEVLGSNTIETPLDHASGLGLWLVHWTATSFGGELAFDTDDDGNVVTLRFPLAALETDDDR